jgi:quercetin dioxygenase-like cupin family protein
MEMWDLAALAFQPHHPQVLHSEDGVARVIALDLPAGEELQEHEVHEHAWLSVHRGAVEVTAAASTLLASAGCVLHWLPQERHTVRAVEDSLLMLMLAPWPGEGHPNLRNQ